MEENQKKVAQEFALEKVITSAIQIPGVKVNRNKFLSEWFSKESVNLSDVIEFGPIEADCSREQLLRLANKLILDRTSKSSVASFAAGIPGGLALAATIPADILQFFAMSLRMAQELSYLYGASDLWQDGVIDDEKVNNQLIMYCGAMFGVSSAISGVRFLSSRIADQIAKKLPQKALTKHFIYRMVKQVAKAVGIKVTKSSFAKGLSKVVPVIGGVVSGGFNFATMMIMGKRLVKALDKANFDYSEEEAVADYDIIIDAGEVDDFVELEETKENFFEVAKNKVNLKEVGGSVSNAFGKIRSNISKTARTENKTVENDDFVKIEKLSKLKDIGAITEEEYEEKKTELLSRI